MGDKKSASGRFAAGNPGRPKGSRNKVTLACEALLDGEGEALTRVAIQKAKEGDMVALRLCMDRLAPPRRDRPVIFAMPELKGAADHPAILAAIVQAVSVGDLTPAEGSAVASILSEHREAVETTDLEARIAALEGRTRA